MKHWRKRLLWIILAIILIGLLTAAAIYFPRKSRDFNHRPLVLIHTPDNRETISLGDAVPLHASAYSQHGMSGIEFWANETLIETRNVDEENPSTTMMLLSSWVPTSDGEHQIIVRAVSESGVEGQAAITIFVEDTDELPPGDEHTVGEGETLEDIAASYGASPEDIADANPGLGSDGPQEGDSLFIPSDDEPAGEGDPLPEGEDPPEAEDDPPGHILTEDEHEREGTTTGLRLELVSLRTNTVFDGLHCYIGLAGATPMWYPDLDGNQSTHESFDIMSGVGGEGASWDTSEYLTGIHAPTVFWPDNAGIPIVISCVGIAEGGEEALELGRSDLLIPPDQWDGIIRYMAVEGPEGSFTFGYRIMETDTEARGVEKTPDPTMSRPTNLRLDDRRNSLRWDFELREDEMPIDGFRIYLNDTLQWTEPPDSRESMLPYEWFHPPCGATYSYTVTAFTYPPDDRESVPRAEDILEVITPRDECNREIYIVWTTLRTFDMPGDGEDDDVHGDVGPVYGSFMANTRHGVSFDCRVDDLRGLDMPQGLGSNREYDLMEISADPGWHFNGMPSAVVEIPEGGTFEFGFHIFDQDYGRCRNSSDPGCDDRICEAMSATYYGAYATEFDHVHEGTLRSENGRCEVDYMFRPNFGSSVGSAGEGGEPLPWIDVEEFIIDASTGQVQVHIRNNGTATWPWRDLDVELQTREGDSLGVYTFEDYVLEVGQRDVLEDSEMVLSAPYDACVVIDPFDEVVELYEVLDVLHHNPICPQLPDLHITNVEYFEAGGGRIRVTIENIGDGAIENRDIVISGALPDGSSAGIWSAVSGASLEPGGTMFIESGGVSERVRDLLDGGYIITVNPDHTIPESNYDNNTYEVQGSTSLQLFWCNRNLPHTHGLTSAARMYFRAWVVSGEGEEQVMDLSWRHHLSGQEVIWDYGHNEYGFPGSWYGCPDESEVFEILGDQWLRITMSATYRAGERGDFENAGTAEFLYGPENGWHSGYMGPDGTYSNCIDDFGRVTFSQAYNLGFLTDHYWQSSFVICEVE